MQRPETKPGQIKNRFSANHAAKFVPVLDSRKRKIRGLVRRGAKFYARLRMDDGKGGTTPKRIPLEAADLDSAKAELERVRTKNRDGDLADPGLRPTFVAATDRYLISPGHLAKKPRTRKDEEYTLVRWKRHLGSTRIDKITAPMLFKYRSNRLREEISARTANKEMLPAYQVLKLAKDLGELKTFPRLDDLKETPPPKRPLLKVEDVEKLIGGCVTAVTKNAELVGFYLRFLAAAGPREQEALLTRWPDVDFELRQVWVGAGGDTKNHKGRPVDFNSDLEQLLIEMKARKQPDSSCLFPSPQRGAKDIPASKLRESFYLVREAVGLSWVGFHDFRHFFASQCVMAGIDFKTISEWLGHSDGGILVGKTYGHVRDDHRRAMAEKLTLRYSATLGNGN